MRRLDEAPRCHVDGCDGKEVWITANLPPECDDHRCMRLTAEVARVGRERCAHMCRKRNEWLERYGLGENGFDVWKVANGRRSRAAWEKIRNRVIRDGIVADWECSAGHEIQIVTRDLGPTSTRRGFEIMSTEPFCGHQPMCRDYVSVQQALDELTQHPEGEA